MAFFVRFTMPTNSTRVTAFYCAAVPGTSTINKIHNSVSALYSTRHTPATKNIADAHCALGVITLLTSGIMFFFSVKQMNSTTEH